MIMFVTKADVKKVNGMNGVACEMSTSDEERYSYVVKFQLTGNGMNVMCLNLFSPYWVNFPSGKGRRERERGGRGYTTELTGTKCSTPFYHNYNITSYLQRVTWNSLQAPSLATRTPSWFHLY